MNKKLSVQVKTKILELIIPLCEKRIQFEEALSKKGMNAFSLMQEFEGRFGNRELHFKFVSEAAKEVVGTPEGGGTKSYKSPYLRRLAKERDERNGMSFQEFQLTNPPVWELELDESKKERLRFQVTKSQEFNVLKYQFDLELKKQKERESVCIVERQYKPMSTFDAREKLSYMVLFLQQYLEPLGFEIDKAVSSKTYPVFSKGLTSSFCLSCGIKNYDELVIQNDVGSVELIFHIRSVGFAKSKVEVSPFVKDKNDDYFLILNSNVLVPYFRSCYTSFNSIEEMKLNILAQVVLFNMALRKVESKLVCILQGIED